MGVLFDYLAVAESWKVSYVNQSMWLWSRQPTVLSQSAFKLFLWRLCFVALIVSIALFE